MYQCSLDLLYVICDTQEQQNSASIYKIKMQTLKCLLQFQFKLYATLNNTTVVMSLHILLISSYIYELVDYFVALKLEQPKGKQIFV